MKTLQEYLIMVNFNPWASRFYYNNFQYWAEEILNHKELYYTKVHKEEVAGDYVHHVFLKD